MTTNCIRVKHTCADPQEVSYAQDFSITPRKPTKIDQNSKFVGVH